MKVMTMQDLLLDELKDIYSAEKQAVRIYPKLIKSAATAELKSAFQAHFEETKSQVERLDRVFQVLEKKPTGKSCEAMKGLLAEATEVLESSDAGPLRDAALIGAAQRVEHYEIAAYGTVISFSKALGQQEISGILAETLEEEKATDKKLTAASRSVNKQALAAEEEDEDEEEEEEEEEDDDDDEEYEDDEDEGDEEGDEDEDFEDDEDEVDDEDEDEEEEEEEEEEPAPARGKAARK